VANLPPLCWLMNRVFGPRSQSCYVTDPRIIDPHLVTIGRNVIIGFGSMIAGHHQEQDRVVIQPTVIEDDVLIGGYAAISGAHIKKGAKVGAGSVVLPGSVIGEYEYWSGNPARRRQRLKQRGDAESPKD
ncbi:MAG: DapH/DapD/GlmU-related protein, partial [Phycisphaerae bacterium]